MHNSYQKPTNFDRILKKNRLIFLQQKLFEKNSHAKWTHKKLIHRHFANSYFHAKIRPHGRLRENPTDHNRQSFFRENGCRKLQTGNREQDNSFITYPFEFVDLRFGFQVAEVAHEFVLVVELLRLQEVEQGEQFLHVIL